MWHYAAQGFRRRRARGARRSVPGAMDQEAQPYTPKLALDAGLVALEWLTPSEGERVASRRPPMAGRAAPGVPVSA